MTAAILLIPLVWMQFSEEVKWTLTDFAAAGILIFGAGLAYELTVKRVKDQRRRLALIALLILLFLYIWAELAVGIFFHFGS